jgi:hypothetical protein
MNQRPQELHLGDGRAGHSADGGLERRGGLGCPVAAPVGETDEAVLVEFDQAFGGEALKRRVEHGERAPPAPDQHDGEVIRRAAGVAQTLPHSSRFEDPQDANVNRFQRSDHAVGIDWSLNSLWLLSPHVHFHRQQTQAESPRAH